jgi:hypothetical protein
MKTFREYFIAEAVKEDKKDQTPKKINKINVNFEDELRKLYKIKSVINTAFGVQIDFYKKPEKDEILNLVDSEVKFKGNSIFILFN